MLVFTETVGRSCDEILRLPAPVLARLMKMGGAVARFVRGPEGRKAAGR